MKNDKLVMKNEKITNAIFNLVASAEKLSCNWNPELLDNDYPFDDDFETVVCKLQAWQETVKRKIVMQQQLYAMLNEIVKYNDSLSAGQRPITFKDETTGKDIHDPFYNDADVEVDPIATYGLMKLMEMVRKWYNI